ncbi:MAG TPA: hypothetical protein VIH21_03390 [Dehalococcoidia bacterium]
MSDAGHPAVTGLGRVALAASRGVEKEIEVVKHLLPALRHGPEHLGVIRDGLTR